MFALSHQYDESKLTHPVEVAMTNALLENKRTKYSEPTFHNKARVPVASELLSNIGTVISRYSYFDLYIVDRDYYY